MRTFLATDGFGRSVAILAGGTAVGQGLVLLASPLLTRLYTVGEIGTFGLFSAFLLVGSVVVTGEYEFAIVAASDDQEAAYLACLAIALTPPIAFVATCVLLLLRASSILGYGGFPLAGVGLVAVGLMATGVTSASRYWLLRAGSISFLSRVTALQQGARAGSQVALGFVDLGFSGLAVGDTLGRLLGTAVMARSIVPGLRRDLSPFRGRTAVSVATRHWKFPFLTLPSSLLDTIAALLPLPLVAQRYGLQAAGFFTLVQRLLALPSALIGQSVADVFHDRIARLKADAPSEAEPLFIRTIMWMLALGLVPAVILLAFGPWLFSTIFGPSWQEAGRVAAAMSVWFVAGLAISPVSRVVFVFDGQIHKFTYDSLSLLATVGAFAWGSVTGASFVAVVWGLSVMNMLAYLVYYLLLLRTLRKGVAAACAE